MISKTQIFYPLLLLMFSSHMFEYSNAVMDTISPGQRLHVSETIISATQMFELGFFSPSNSSVNYHLAIWYRNITEKTVVWLANRDYPVSDSAVLSISVDGNLVIKHGRIIYMVTEMETNGNVSATLLDSGNLVVRDERSNTLWQSFDFPCHTFLPGMKLGYDTRSGKNWSYVSWKSDDDPSPGNFTLKLDSREDRILIMNGDDESWRSKLWEEDDNIIESPPDVRLNMLNFSLVTEFDMTYFTYDIYSKDLISRLMIDATGQVRQFSLSENEWFLLNSQPGNPCDVYAYCGANSSCTNVLSSTNCSCLPGFQPNSPEVWKEGNYKLGCSRISTLQCGNDTNINGARDGFLKLSNVVLPKKPQTLEAQTLSECSSSCLNNCSCTGYSYINRNCSIWIDDLINLQQLSANDTSGTDFFLKLGKHKPSKRKQLIIIVSVTLSVSILTSALCIWNVMIGIRV